MELHASRRYRHQEQPLSLDDLWPSFHEERVLHHDDDLLVIDKPEGMSTHAPEPDRTDDARSRLIAWLRERGEAEPYVGIHQRLDRDTSGVLLFTRRKSANPSIAEQFESRRVKKTYVAAVTGKRIANEGRLEHDIVPGEDGKMRALEPRGKKRGQSAALAYRVIDRRGERAVLEVKPETGRTHQIRVQLAAAGMPIAGDALYGGAPSSRLMLHATELAIVHPSTKKPISFRAAPPAEIAGFSRGLSSPRSIEERLRVAADKRYEVARSSGTTAFRIAHGAGDDLPGITADVYGEHLVVGLTSDEAVRDKDAIFDACAKLGAKGVYAKMRPKHASVIVDSRREEYAPSHAVRGEDAPPSFTILENGLSFVVRLGDGLSTGIFLDQRENRRRVRELSKGARALNLFAYTGAFTIAAAAGGAVATTTVDVSRSALAWAEENLKANGIAIATHALVDADALVWMRGAQKRKERYDLILLDPPSFATTKTSRFSAESDYKELATLAFALLSKPGKLLACTNHRGFARLKFRRHLHEAARAAGVEVVQMKDLPDPPDHPAEPGAEPHLKSVLVTVR